MGGWVWMRVAVLLGHGVGEGQVNEQGKEQDEDQREGQGVVGVRRMEIAVCQRRYLSLISLRWEKIKRN